MVKRMEIKNSDLAGAIDAIATLSQAAQKIERIEKNGREYLISRDCNGSPRYQELTASDDTCYPECMYVNTLQAFVNYILFGIKNGEIKDKLYINVISPTKVIAETPVNEYGKRKTIVSAERYNLRSFTFGQYNSFEEFVVALQSHFIASDERGQLLTSLKSMTQSNEVHTEDNGVSQTVVAKSGATLGQIQVSPIWNLSPYRTFTEIPQPTSLFLLRLRQQSDGAEFALYETDGGAWAITAMESIKDYLCGRLSDLADAGKVSVL